jgi:DNA-binding response OmpR family regulator
MGKKRVMIVDDDKGFLEELKEMLTLSGYETAAFLDGDSALRMIHRIKPDIILLDLKMSHKSGLQLAYELKRLPDVRVPIIAMTAFFTEREHAGLMDVCGIQTCFIKPFSPQAVIAKIEKILQERRG